MNIFDKICAVLAVMLGVVLLVLGVIRLFVGCGAQFTLPPILGAIPALVGWGIIKPIIVAWKAPRKVGISASGGLGPDVLEERKLPNENAF